jgi:D-alanyl-D-alanine carboxypeptidase
MNEVDLFLDMHVASDHAPSVQYVIFDRDRVIHQYQTGLADIKEHRKADEQTTYNAYSVTKTFTALAIMQLVEKGMLSIDHPVKQYLRDFPYSPEITIRQLLSHSAGIPNPIPLSWIHLAEEHASFNRNAYFKPVFAKHNKTRFAPNEKFAYTNLGYILLGKLIEEVTGHTYEEYITHFILEPLDLQPHDLGFTIPDLALHAKGYHKRRSFSNLMLSFFINKTTYMDKPERSWKPFKPFYVNGTPYGGLIGTPHAFVKYIQALLKTDNALITEDSKQIMFKENYTNTNKPTGMSLSWFCGQLNGHQYHTHAGGGGGFYVEMRIYRDPGMGSVIMFNRTGMTDERFLSKVDKYFL